jgi:hypothetical protein
MIGSVGSYSNGGRAIQRPPMGVDYKMSTEQKSKLKEILAKYSSKDTSEEGMQAMKNEIQAAGIRPGGDLGTALHAAGFKVGPPPERGASGGGGPEGPERAGNEGDADHDRGAVGAGPQGARSLRAPKGVSEAQGANTQLPQGGPQGPMSGASGVLVQPPQFIRDFMSKLQEGSPTESDLADFIKNLRAQNEQASGFLFNQTA